MAYRLGCTAALPYQNSDGSWTAIYDCWVGDYPEDIPALLKEMKRYMNQTLTEKIKQLTQEIQAINANTEKILLDPQYINSNGRDYTELVQSRLVLVKRIWTLKGNWE